MAAVGIWERLPPDEFKQLQEYTKYSKRRLKDVLSEFREGLYEDYNTEQPMGYDGFKIFMSSYLGDTVSDELCQTLFWTFHKKVPASDAANIELPNALLKKFLVENGKLDSIDGYDSAYTRIAKGARRATVVATATVVAGINRNDSPRGEHASPRQTNLNSSMSSNKSAFNDSLQPGNLNKKALSDFEVSNCHHDNHINQGQKSLSFDESTGDLNNQKTSAHELAYVPMIEIKEIACYLSLLEGGDVQDKLEFVFRVYDCDMNNYLDQQELESIVSQMIRVAEYLGWDTSVLKPILTDMLAEMDFDADGQISMEEWVKGGMNNIPFLVLLGMDVKVDEEGRHQWQMKHFKSQAYCNICHSTLTGFGRKQGLQCIFCRYTCHERCVNRVPNSCIQTYTETKSKRKKVSMDHHWVEGNCPGKCTKCNKNIKMNCLTGLHCVWCQAQVHNRCVNAMQTECSLGPHRVHILPPICITPQTKKVKEHSKVKKNSVISYDGIPMLISPLPNTQPLVVFVNPKSGGRQGARLLNKFRYILNPRQVFNLADNGPLPGLKFFSQVPNFRVLCCGGDGTAGWILSTIDRLSSIKQRPAMSILPLGTGNDLARCLGWGGGYDGGSIDKCLWKTANSSVVMMDRWQIDCEETEKSEEGDVMPQSIMNNYFSIGVDASIALKFHLQREKSPEKFNSRFKNKLRYFEAGTSEQLAASCKGLHNDIEIYCDGKKLELPSLEGIAILNIPSIYGGANIWGETEKKRRRGISSKDSTDLSTVAQDMGDKKIEVVGLENSLYVGQIIAGVRQHGLRLAQCSSVMLKVKRTLPMQVDGEPWMQAPAELSISHKNQTPMCVAPVPTRRGLFGRFGKKDYEEKS
ncbi:diacylglycerol kinase beta-like isoform X1 [Hydractinia symbiolongicarpus]|uniref:diacylglycerol kinase beta-like isoform X1 n=1 Tax=Hydractinia symbiolongicarpus TaxID=13093 RepID=UPI00254F6CD7|nr:diacylglycerol kinase beta-like isoform X1 [Hydractinia symbiolongicarpus]